MIQPLEASKTVATWYYESSRTGMLDDQILGYPGSNPQDHDFGSLDESSCGLPRL
jgi:hypothetical protein